MPGMYELMILAVLLLTALVWGIWYAFRLVRRHLSLRERELKLREAELSLREAQPDQRSA